MKRKMVWGYWCDYCGKFGRSGGHMKRHEARCIKNPNRHCGMCYAAGNSQPEMSELVALASPLGLFWTEDRDETPYYNSAEAKECAKCLLPELMEAADNCPACVLAALAQNKVPAKDIGFDFEKEKTAFWSAVNENEMRREYYALSLG